MDYKGKNGEYFEVIDVSATNHPEIKNGEKNALTLLWFQDDRSELIIDKERYSFNKNQITCLTGFHQFEVINASAIKTLKFNKDFYCVLDHDSEVGCKGILYYGANSLPILTVKDQDATILKTVWEMLQLEMGSKDDLQLEMLQMMLKRILILCTRIYKSQIDLTKLTPPHADLVRAFNFLVEENFRTMHTVNEYAALLFKSPKTLSNLFKKIGSKSPLEFIQLRILLESKRLLSYTSKGISEIAYEVGYEDVQSFSRFFKKKSGHSPSHYRNNH